jgi:hypothetical protein
VLALPIMLVAVPVLGAGGALVLALPIMVVCVPIPVPGSPPIRARLIMLAWCFAPVAEPLVMPAVVPCIVPTLVPLIMLVLMPWPRAVEGAGEGLPKGLAASAVEAPMAIMPAARAPTSRGRLKAVTFCRGPLAVPISLLYQAVMVNSFVICPFLRDTCRLPQRCSGCGQEP